MIEFSCSACGNPMRVNDDAAGKRGTCKLCGEQVTVPQSSSQLPERYEHSITSPPITHPARTSPQVAVQVNVPRQSAAAHSLGIASIALGMTAFLICWIPLVGAIGIPLSGLGLLLGIIGLVIAAVRQGRGIGFPIAGSAISAIALFVAFTMTMAITGIPDAVERARAAARDAADDDDSGDPAIVEEAAAAEEQVVKRDDDIDINADDEGNRPAPGDTTSVEVDDGPSPSDDAETTTPTMRSNDTSVVELVNWVPANKPFHAGEVSIEIKAVTLSKVPLNHLGDRTSSQEEFLVIDLSITNRGSKRKINYLGWAGKKYDVFDQAAQLTDSNDNTYKRIGFGISSVIGQVSSESIYPSEAITDRLVFERPVNGVQTLNLELPLNAVGGDGSARFVIPTESVRRTFPESRPITETNSEPGSLMESFSAQPLIGMHFIPISEIADLYELATGAPKQGLVVIVDSEDSIIGSSGISTGDVIFEIDDKRVWSEDDLREWIASPPDVGSHKVVYYKWSRRRPLWKFTRRGGVFELSGQSTSVDEVSKARVPEDVARAFLAETYSVP